MDWDVASSLDRTYPPVAASTRVLEVDEAGGVGSTPLDEAPRDGDVFVGVEQDVAWYARTVPALGGDPVTFRERPGDVFATACTLLRWHGMDPRCERCHGRTEPIAGGQRRRCVECGELAFCRTDPAVIMAITDDRDRLLLARHRTWPEARRSVIAGFVEPGESLEQACAREAREEVDIELSRIRYFGSQPWPFPCSLMAGFTARAGSSELREDGEEIVEASFLTREELASAVDAGRISLPGHASIARRLIDAWRQP